MHVAYSSSTKFNTLRFRERRLTVGCIIVIQEGVLHLSQGHLKAENLTQRRLGAVVQLVTRAFGLVAIDSLV